MKIFVFGSNLAGVHGAGAALFAAQHHGAVYGCGEGRQGDSYGIPTKDHRIQTRSLEDIAVSVRRFIRYAYDNQNLTFQVTRIGCGLAGFVDAQIAPLFKGAPPNCEMPNGWRDLMGS